MAPREASVITAAITVRPRVRGYGDAVYCGRGNHWGLGWGTIGGVAGDDVGVGGVVVGRGSWLMMMS